MTSRGTVPLTILGSTGSIGTQALDVVAGHPRFEVFGLAAGGSQLGLLSEQVYKFKPEKVAVAVAIPSSSFAQEGSGAWLLAEAVEAVGATLLVGPGSTEALAGANRSATVLNGVTGGIGLEATLQALEVGSRLALANKESLVVGGALVKDAIQYPGQVVPVDSEHSAIAQALLSGVHEKGMVSPVVTGRSELFELVLTASGGPFRGRKRSELEDVTAEQALAHPTWSMGPVVTVNSSTLMNKGLELIEAALLFDVDPDAIVPVVHPQSIIHSMVTWQDGSTIAQASYPDMRVPIALGLDWPTHLEDVGVPLKWGEAAAWTFEPVDNEVFPALSLAKASLKASPTHPAVLNASNEVGVDAFLDGRVRWVEIVDAVEAVLGEHEGVREPSLTDVLEVQRWAAKRTDEVLGLGEGA